MPISLSTAPVPPGLGAALPVITTAGAQGSAAQADLAAQAAERAIAPPRADAGEVETTAEGERVTLSSTGEAGVATPELAPVYAEIWKDGVKIAVVDTHGGVTGLNGVISTTTGTAGAGGAELAARRAALIAHQVGGEIRVGGQTLDSQTLAMRTKLKAAYGA